jgi:phosphoribosylaminoimidazole (AIR) synthetase
MILVVGKRQADAVIGALAAMGEKAYVVGAIQKGARGASLRS